MRYVPFVLAVGLAAASACSQEQAPPVPRAGDAEKVVRETIRQLNDKMSAVPRDDKVSAVPREAAGEYVVRVLVAPEIETTLASPLLGRLRSLNVSLGSRFEKGNPLVVFHCEEQAARMAMGAAEVAAARENHEAKLRLQGLQSAAEIEVALAAAALEKARAQLALYQTQAAECIVKAPFAGRAAKIHVKPHQSVTAGQPLVDIVNEAPPKLRLNVPSKWLAWLTRGRVFTVAIDETHRTYQARVTAINARVDAASQTVELEATVNNPGPELLPGMSGTAMFDLR